MNEQHERTIRRVAHWLETITDLNAEPLILIAEQPTRNGVRVMIFSADGLSIPAALAVLNEALQNGIQQGQTIDRLIAPRGLP